MTVMREYTCAQQTCDPPWKIVETVLQRHLVGGFTVELSECEYTYETYDHHRDHHEIENRHVEVLSSCRILVLCT